MSSTTVPNPQTRPLTSFSVLTLDIYGTLIDWETSMFKYFEPILSRLPDSHSLKTYSDPEDGVVLVAKAFSDVENALLKEKPDLKYATLLTEAYGRFAQGLGITSNLQQEAEAFGSSVGSWVPYPDTIDAMNRLHKHFKLVPLSNVDKESFRKTCEGPLKDLIPGFDAIYTAEDIGSYKPSLKNFEYLFDHLQTDLGFSKDQILHTAQSITADHVPAKQLGLTSAWIARRQEHRDGLADELIRDGKVGFSWRFNSLGEMADAVEKEIAAKGSGRTLHV
ncbi:hypothetical protein AK830_g3036 [Neonectria ditissima]|uniref:Haloacid dehalogenase, type II n=1 Tax=Neonectria ditissima TaxID=78410 RepID=A0A0P7BQX9_9HYPO|nr:hypothetical protein AK830_g3036 [Neonectria ditissima]